MTQDELRLEEAAQSIRLSAQERLDEWADEAVSEVFDAHRSQLQQPASQEGRSALLQQGLEEAIAHRTSRSMLTHAMDALKETALFSKDQLLSMEREVGLALERLPVRVPLQLPPALAHLAPLRTALVIGLLGCLGAFLGNLLPGDGSLPLIGGLLFAATGVLGLVQLQTRQLLAPHRDDAASKLFGLVSVDATAGSDGLAGPRDRVEEALQVRSAALAQLVQLVGMLHLRRQEDRQEDTDILQHLFHKCVDGFAEVYYGDLKRDPERALDACIKLVGDLQGAGVDIVTVERGTPFSPPLEANFTLAGRVTEGDPVMMIHPAWQWRGRTLAKGTIKRTRR